MDDAQGVTLPAGASTAGGGVGDRVGVGGRIGRYVLVQELGRGGMGVVYAAHDPMLDRRVAIKLLSGRIDAVARARLVREARALARVSHPNVVGVHEIASHGEQLFVAMELVDGMSLRAWQDAAPRPWQACVAAYVGAGRGLAAVHAAGIVHRDFKPHNAMMDRSGPDEVGRVRVLDFGLAIGERNESDRAAATPGEALASDEGLTARGTLVGTPAYMAPEQIAGRPTTPATDQFAFCVSLWEALEGVRPFVGATIPLLHAAIVRGEPVAPRSERATPAWLLALLRRGLGVRPEDRFPDMLTLVEELERPRGSRRSRALRGGVGVAVVAGAVGITWASTRVPDPCDAIASELDEVWSPARREALRTGLAEVGIPAAPEIATRTDAALARWAEGWIAARTEACELARDHPTDPEARASDRMQCLARRRTSFAALIDVLASADVERAGAALEAVAGLPDVAACADPSYLATAPLMPSDPALASAVDRVRVELAHVHALLDAGDPRAARVAAETALAHTAGIAHPPLAVEAHDALAEALLQLGTLDSALAAIREGYVDAPLAGTEEQHANLVLLATILLERGDVEAALLEARRSQSLARVADEPRQLAGSALVVGLALDATGRTDEAIASHRDGLAAAAGLRPSDPTIGMLHNALANALAHALRFDEAVAEHRRALAAVEQAYGPEHPGAGITHSNVALVLADQGDREGALREAELGLEIVRRALGDSHPTVAIVRNNLAGVLRITGDLAGATREVREAIAVLTRARGPDDLGVALLRANLGSLSHALGRDDDAMAELELALAVLPRVLGADDPRVAAARDTFAIILSDAGDHVSAAREHRAALAIRERALGPDHPDVALSHSNIAADLHEAGDDAAALPEHRRALAIRERVLPANHTDIIESHRGIAASLAGLGRHVEALAERRLVAAMLEAQISVDAASVAVAHARIAEELDATGDDAAALAEARKAFDGLVDVRGGTGRTEALVGLVLAVVATRAGERSLAHEAATRAQAIAAAHPDAPGTQALALLASAIVHGDVPTAQWRAALQRERTHGRSTLLTQVAAMLEPRAR